MGTLYICGTPIGNLEDVSIRLLKTLRKVDLIACEDTRQTLKLLNRYKIKNKMISYHKYSRPGKEEFLISQLSRGKDVALVSDAGMPGISDPGEMLIKKAINAGINIEVIPGPVALIAALSISGFDSSAFVFAGFLPASSAKRRQSLQQYLTEKRTVIVYEAPHRLNAALADVKSILGSKRVIAVARELTKKFEEVKRGPVEELMEYYQANPPKGEFCLLIEGIKETMPPELDIILKEIEELISSGVSKKEALKIKAREFRIKKADLYKHFIGYDD